MLDELRRVLEEDQGIVYALLFGSGARGRAGPASDVDVAVELGPDAPRDAATLGRLAARLESVAGRPVDLVLMEVAPAPLAYRIFRDGRVLDHLEAFCAALASKVR